ncbi:hypothetical protein O9929_00010 [Vibrio lentus]|nr:hypothetical protein [Vibrio lentus]
MPYNANYFNTFNLREQLDQLGRCRFMDREEFTTKLGIAARRVKSSLLVVVLKA